MGWASSRDGLRASIISVSPKSYTMCSKMSLSACTCLHSHSPCKGAPAAEAAGQYAPGASYLARACRAALARWVWSALAACACSCGGRRYALIVGAAHHLEPDMAMATAFPQPPSTGLPAPARAGQSLLHAIQQSRRTTKPRARETTGMGRSERMQGSYAEGGHASQP